MTCFNRLGLLGIPAALVVVAGSAAGQDPRRDANGFVVHVVESEFQHLPVEIRVLAPSRPEPGKKYPVIYVLPVEPLGETRWGDAGAEVKKLDLADRRGVIFVYPTFSRLPWYADHPTDPRQRHEAHFLKVVVPFVEKHYPAAAEPAGRLLLGFSKSGWGAFTLLLRRPDTFGRAAAFDAPLTMDWPSKYGSADLFATAENFTKYRVWRLLEERGPQLGKAPRLAILGAGNFQKEHALTHQLLEKLTVPHRYRDGPVRKHAWGSGWLEEAVEFLLTPAEPDGLKP
jgi:hypothetical protein